MRAPNAQLALEVLLWVCEGAIGTWRGASLADGLARLRAGLLELLLTAHSSAEPPPRAYENRSCQGLIASSIGEPAPSQLDLQTRLAPLAHGRPNPVSSVLHC